VVRLSSCSDATIGSSADFIGTDNLLVIALGRSRHQACDTTQEQRNRGVKPQIKGARIIVIKTRTGTLFDIVCDNPAAQRSERLA